jgi:hypothetical protein
MKPIRTVFSICIAANFGLAVGSAAEAQDSGWRYEVAPYIWGAGISGTVAAAPGLPPAEVDASFSDILKRLDMGAFVFGAATKDRFGLMADLQYISLSEDAEALGGLLSGTVESKTLVFSLGAEWVLSETETGELRAIGGGRLWKTDTDIALTVGPGGGTISGSDDWWDAMVGLRGRHNLSDKSYLTGVALVGGGGSDFMADVFLGYGYRLSERTALTGGYRFLKVDRRNGDFVYDVEQQGILLGLNFSFE